MTNKKQTITRLAVFLLLSFGLTYLMFFIYIANFGWTIDSKWYGVMASCAMLCPTIANVLTRLITKEGFENSLFAFKPGGKMKYVLIAFLVPFVSDILKFIITAIFILPSGTIDKVFQKENITDFLCNTLYLFAVTVSVVLPGFGEEFGWRGYLTPKLEKLMSLPSALVVSGIIWGLWHAPIIACGHNFGTDYSGYPWTGIGMMCIFCICTGVYLTAITKATGSTIFAGLAHMAINNIGGAVSATLFSYAEITDSEIAGFDISTTFNAIIMLIMPVVALITGIIILVVTIKSDAKKQLSVKNFKPQV